MESKQMKKLHLTGLVILLASLLTACSGATPTPAPTERLAPTVPAVTGTPIPPTITPAPTPTATAVVFSGPASKYLPVSTDFSNIYESESSLVADNLLLQAQIPVARENVGYASYKNIGTKFGEEPQSDIYFRFTYWVIVAPDETSAKLLYGLSGQPDYQKQAFLVIMPASVQESMGGIRSIANKQSPCDDIRLGAVDSDIYASFRKGPMPTRDPRQMNPMDPARLAALPPDLYLSSTCRVKNVMVLVWAYLPNNYQGKNIPVPDDVLANNVNTLLQVVTKKLQ
jgi:hypothetical protein